MGIITYIVLGGIAGWIASMIMGEREGIFMNIIIGIAGAFIGGIIMRLFGGVGVTGFNIGSIIVAIIGAIVVLWIIRALRGGGRKAS